MILSFPKVQDACARIDNGNVRFTFHRISEPVTGGLPIYSLDKPRGRR